MIKSKYLNPINIINYIMRLRRKRTKITQQQMHEAYKAAFLASPSGRLVLEHLSNIHFAGRQTFHKDPLQTAFNEGRRFVVESIIHTISNDYHALEKLSKQITEQTNVMIDEEQ